MEIKSIDERKRGAGGGGCRKRVRGEDRKRKGGEIKGGEGNKKDEKNKMNGKKNKGKETREAK